MKQVYIASPLRGDYEENTKNAVRYCEQASEMGVIPLAPHIIFSQWCDDSVPELRERGLQLGLELLAKSDELWVMGSEISEGMRGEIDFAKERGIKTYHIREPNNQDLYPISADDNSLLSTFDTIDGSKSANYESLMVLCNHTKLKSEYRTPRNQIWIATHGPGCSLTGVKSDTIHLIHPIDGDRMIVGRSDILGIIKPQVLEAVYATYGVKEVSEETPHILPNKSEEISEEFCR